MNLMLVIRKKQNEEADIINLSNDELNNVLYKCEQIEVDKKIYVLLDPEETFDDDNFNCQLKTPYNQGKIFCFGTIYIIKKNLFGAIKRLNEGEVKKVLSYIDNKKPEHWWD